MDEKDETGFDGEDAWQIVESWGNSNSPAMSENRQVELEHVGIEADEKDGYVEPSKASSLQTSQAIMFVIRNRQYHEYMEHNEGDHGLEPLQ